MLKLRPLTLHYWVRRCSTNNAAIIVIGDEILKGQVKDTNSYFLTKQLYKRGYKVSNIKVIPDSVDIISNSIQKSSKKHKVVLLTGGIGPTHDDVTYEALATAFGDQLFYHPDIVQMVKDYFKTNDEGHPAMKLALIPKKSLLTFGTDPQTGKKVIYPNVSLNNVFVFPGVPHLCERMFLCNSDKLFPVIGCFHTAFVYSNAPESEVAKVLNQAVAKFNSVNFGSYPVFFHNYYSVRLSLESSNQKDVKEAEEFLKLNIPGCVPYDADYLQNRTEKLLILENDKLNICKSLLDVTVSKFGPDKVYLYFDGGKNSTLLLHILSIIYEDLGHNLTVIYVETNPKVRSYVEKAVNDYKVGVLTMNFESLLRFANAGSDICVVKGISLDDNRCESISYAFSVLPYINPLSSFTEEEVWSVIKRLSLPYCSLYDQGSKSLSSQ